MDVELPSIGLGGAPLGGLFESVGNAEAVAAVQSAVHAGYRFVDTAPFYGLGASERAVGEALAGDREVVLSTKAGRIIDPAGVPVRDGVFPGVTGGVARFDFSRDGVRRSVFESLERLGRDEVDIVFIHDPDDHADQAIVEAYPALEELRDEGILSGVGIGMNQPEIPMRFIHETDIDVVLIAGQYTLLDRSASRLFDEALDRDIPIIAAGVYNSGILAPTALPLTFDYAPAPGHLLAQAERLAHLCGLFDVPLAAAAVQFPLRHPAVASVLIGARSSQEAVDNLAYATVEIPDELWQQLEERQGIGPED